LLFSAPVPGRGGPVLLSHRGWQRLLPDGSAVAIRSAVGPRLTTAIEKTARLVRESSDGQLVCLRREDGAVELWRTDDDARTSELGDAAASEIAVSTRGCLVLGQRAWWIDSGGRSAPLSLESQPLAIAIGLPGNRDELLVASGEQLHRLEPSGVEISRERIGGGATALALVGGELLIGYVDGSIERAPSSRNNANGLALFERAHSGAVLIVAEGPGGTVAAGFAGGGVALWDRSAGRLLASARLNGPITQLASIDGTLYVASELGGHLAWDLTSLARDGCELLREVWQRVPTVWNEGRAGLAQPSSDHRCR
jgi:hypothetical protein